MDKTLALKSRLNSSFGILSLFSLVSLFISVYSLILYFIAQIFIEELALGEFAYEKADFYIMFVIPQILLPVLTALVGCLIPIVGKFKIKDCIKNEKVPARYFILCLFIFPGLSTICSYASYLITYFLNLIGIPIADINSAIPMPNGIFETVLLFFVMAVLPAICEELIYRGFLLRGLSEYGRVGAIVVSSIAFGLMHATVQQIPFAFAIGLFLGYITLRFKSIVLPMILHFINNFIACALMVMQGYMSDELLSIVTICLDIFFVSVSVLDFVIFIILTVHEKETEELESQITGCEDTESENNSLPVVEERADFLSAAAHSWGFWLFTVIYLVSTVINVVAMAFSV